MRPRTHPAIFSRLRGRITELPFSSACCSNVEKDECRITHDVNLRMHMGDDDVVFKGCANELLPATR